MAEAERPVDQGTQAVSYTTQTRNRNKDILVTRLIDVMQFLQEEEQPFSVTSACRETHIGKTDMRTWLKVCESRGPG